MDNTQELSKALKLGWIIKKKLDKTSKKNDTIRLRQADQASH